MEGVVAVVFNFGNKLVVDDDGGPPLLFGDGKQFDWRCKLTKNGLLLFSLIKNVILLHKRIFF